MSRWADALTRAMAQATVPGDELRPTALIARLARQTDPIAALSNHDLTNELFDALDTDLAFIQFARAADKPVEGADFDRLIQAIHWLNRELVDWRKSADPKLSHLTSIFVLAARLDENGLLWDLMPRAVGNSHELAQAMADLLCRVRVTLETFNSRSPLRDQEMMDQFASADRLQDWATLLRHVESTPFAFFASVGVTQSARFLKCFHPDLLASAVRSVNQTALAMQLVWALSEEGALHLGRETENPYLQFGAICRLCASHHRRIAKSEEVALTDLLLMVSRDPKQWPALMKAFNPVQFGMIQTAVGLCLARADDLAFEQYVRCIKLQPGTNGRDNVTNCLSVFSDNAPVEKRRRAWQFAFSHWSDWDFGAGEVGSKLNSVVLSPLDFAIVGYAVECLDCAERQRIISSCFSQIAENEDRWHKSKPECITFFYRALSGMQPFAHAHLCGKDRQSWLMSDHLHIPDDFKNNLYFRLRYQMQQLGPNFHP